MSDNVIQFPSREREDGANRSIVIEFGPSALDALESLSTQERVNLSTVTNRAVLLYEAIMVASSDLTNHDAMSGIFENPDGRKFRITVEPE